MGETIDIVFLTSIGAPYPYTDHTQTVSVKFEHKSTVVGVDVQETGQNNYTLGLVCLRGTYDSPAQSTRFFKITNGGNSPPLNNEVMYVGAAQIRTYHSSFVSGPQSMHVDMGQIYTLHIFEESVY